MAFIVLAAVMAMIDSAHETALYRRYSMAYVCEFSHHAYVVVAQLRQTFPTLGIAIHQATCTYEDDPYQ